MLLKISPIAFIQNVTNLGKVPQVMKQESNSLYITVCISKVFTIWMITLSQFYIHYSGGKCQLESLNLNFLHLSFWLIGILPVVIYCYY